MSLPGFAADWPAPAHVRTWQTIRPGGVSRGAYSSLNLALHVGDDPAAVAANRARLSEGLGLPVPPAWLDQVHGARIVDLDASWSGPADAAVTGLAGTVAAVMTADCVPVLLCNRAGTRAGVAHAGWRGLAAGVVDAAVEALGCDPAEVLAWLGPAISQPAYEVGDEVRAAFVAGEPQAAGAFARNQRGRWQADLYSLARLALAAAGVDSVHGGTECTYADSARFFSHRREAPCGRQATLIWLE